MRIAMLGYNFPTGGVDGEMIRNAEEETERGSPFPTNNSVLCSGSEQRSLFTTTVKCQHAPTTCFILSKKPLGLKRQHLCLEQLGRSLYRRL